MNIFDIDKLNVRLFVSVVQTEVFKSYEDIIKEYNRLCIDLPDTKVDDFTLLQLNDCIVIHEIHRCTILFFSGDEVHAEIVMHRQAYTYINTFFRWIPFSSFRNYSCQ